MIDEKSLEIEEKYNLFSNEILRNQIREALQQMPSEEEALKAYEDLPNKEIPIIFINIYNKINEETAFPTIFNYDEIFQIIKEPKNLDTFFLNKDNSDLRANCSFTGDINVFEEVLAIPYSERMKYFLKYGDFNTEILEHENSHRRVFSPVEDTGTFLSLIKERADEFKNVLSYHTAPELHEIYARLCTINICAGKLLWEGGQDNYFVDKMFSLDSWKYYGVKEVNEEFQKKVTYCINSILAAKLFFTETEIADAVNNHGTWDATTETFAGIEKLLHAIPLEDRDYLAKNYRLQAQLQRVKAVSIAREAIIRESQT